MICHHGEICNRCSMEDYKRHEGTGDNDHKHVCRQLQRCVCNKDLPTGSFQSHLQSIHGMDGFGVIFVQQAALVPRTYNSALSTCPDIVARQSPSLWPDTLTRHVKPPFSVRISSIATLQHACILRRPEMSLTFAHSIVC